MAWGISESHACTFGIFHACTFGISESRYGRETTPEKNQIMPWQEKEDERLSKEEALSIIST